MKKIAWVNRSVAALVISLVLVSTIFAVQMEGNYLSANIGMTHQPVTTYKQINAGASSLKTESKNSPGLDLAYGYQIEDLRVEGSVVFLQNEIKKAVMRSANFEMTADPKSGNTKAMAFMVNGMYDFNGEADFTPYVGFGIGMAHVALNVRGFPTFSATTSLSGSTCVVNNPHVETTVTNGNTTTSTTTYTRTTTKTTTTTPTVTTSSPAVTPIVSIKSESEVSTPPSSVQFPDPGPCPTTIFGPSPGPAFTDVSSEATGKKLQFAFQTISGFSYKISDYFKATLEYRYLRTMSTNFTMKSAGEPVTMDGVYSNHRLMLGVTAFLD